VLMLGIIILVLAIVAAYFIYKGLCARHVARCQHDSRTSEHVPDNLLEKNGQDGAYNAVFNESANTGQSLPSVPVPHDSPSLLYADRKDSVDVNSNQAQYSDVRMTRAENLPINESLGNADTLDLTAETATLSSEEVGVPANNSDYIQPKHDEHTQSAFETDAFKSDGNVAANAQVHEQQSAIQATGDNNNHNNNIASTTIAAGAMAAGVAGAAVTSNLVGESNASPHIHGNLSNHESGHSVNEGIDLELGDNTGNAAQDLDDDHDELLDFGDLTADISEMLKELNLRESDSPRLEINEAEYQQLKTGEPGEVKPEKIENVAGKLRNMLQ